MLNHQNHQKPKREKNTIIDYRSNAAVGGSAVIHATGVLGAAVMVDGPSPVFFGDKFLHLPVALLGANTELKILFRN